MTTMYTLMLEIRNMHCIVISAGGGLTGRPGLGSNPGGGGGGGSGRGRGGGGPHHHGGRGGGKFQRTT